jgi:predicted NAD/FAD-dependent oxidoreductase
MKKIAVIGAGLTGATAAARLTQAGYQVVVFDKGRVAGGRMSSKRTDQGYLDMGAQYFTARSEMFKQQVKRWVDAGQVQVWPCTTALLCNDDGVLSLTTSADHQQRYIGVPAMQSPVKALLEGLSLISGCRITALAHQQTSWSLHAEDGHSYPGFDAVLLTLPPVQAQQLLAQSALPELFQAAAGLLEPCWAVAMQADVCGVGDAIFCQHPKLRFISHQQHKPGRAPCYILHFNAAFSAAHLDHSQEFWFAQASDILRQELKIELDIKPIVAHRWLYASQQDQTSAPGFIALPQLQLWAGGDWSYGGRVENAYLAGLELARTVMASVVQQKETA